MALIEVALKVPQFGQVIDLALTSAPIPVPTLAALGPTRLVSGLRWGQAVVVTDLPGIANQPGKVPAQVPVTVVHVSVDELRLNAAAPGSSSPATAWLLVSATPGRILVDIIAMAFPGRAPDIYSDPVSMGGTSVPLPKEVQAASAAIVATNEIITIRFGTKPGDDLLTPAADPEMGDGNWRIRVSGEFFTEYVLDALNAVAAKPPDSTEVEDSPTAIWTTLPFGAQWAVLAGIGLKKVDACPGLFSDVDISVSVSATLTLDVKPGDDTFGVNVLVRTDASDWDSFRCWAGSGGLASVAISSIFTPVVGIGFAIGTGIAIGEVVKTDAGASLDGFSAGKALTQVASDDTSITLAGVFAVPKLPPVFNTPTVTAEGLVVTGTMLLPPASLEPIFVPDGGLLSGVWHGYYSCRDKVWRRDFLLPSIKIANAASAIGIKLPAVPVRIFPTSAVEPNNQWRLDVLTTIEPVQWVEMVALAPVNGTSGRLYLHTDAGIRRFDVPPLPPPPPVPDDLTIALAAFNCRLWPEVISERVKLTWLVDPPEFDGADPELPVIRQWMLAIEQLAAGSAVSVRAVRGAETVTLLRGLTADVNGEFIFEAVTDSRTELELNLHVSEGRTGVRLMQRWLLPTSGFDIGVPALALARHKGAIFALTGGRLFRIDRASNQMTSLPSRQRGLINSRGRLILWGESGIEELDGNQVLRLSRHSVEGVLSGPQPEPRLVGASEIYDIDGRVRGRRDHKTRIRNVLPLFSISLSERQVVAAFENQLVFATPALTNVRTDYAIGNTATSR
jgi:hypothetical protein